MTILYFRDTKTGAVLEVELTDETMTARMDGYQDYVLPFLDKQTPALASNQHGGGGQAMDAGRPDYTPCGVVEKVNHSAQGSPLEKIKGRPWNKA